MPAERVSMRRIREILRLKYEGGATERAIARSIGVARSTVALTLERVAAARLGWPMPEGLSDRALEAMLYAGAGRPQGSRGKTEPDWTHVHHELRRPGVTLMLLWEEYRQAEPDGYGYTCASSTAPGRAGCRRPCARSMLPARSCSSISPAAPARWSMPTPARSCRCRSSLRCSGASSFTYAEAVWSQKLPDWIGAHVRAFAYFGGAARQTVSDNLKAGITKASFHEPMVNRTYADMARHYRTAIVPARPYKPRDKIP